MSVDLCVAMYTTLLAPLPSSLSMDRSSSVIPEHMPSLFRWKSRTWPGKEQIRNEPRGFHRSKLSREQSYHI